MEMESAENYSRKLSVSVSKENSCVRFKPPTDQRFQLLKLQNRDPSHSFTDGRILCRDGYILIHYGVLMAGASYHDLNSKTIDATKWSVEFISTAVFLFYLGQSRVTLHENSNELLQLRLEDRLKALSVDPDQVVLLTPLLLQNATGLKRNRLLDEISSASLDGLGLRFTRTDDENGHSLGDYLISTDGNIAPIPSSEVISSSELPSTLTDPTPGPADSTFDVSPIQRTTENRLDSSPIMCRLNCERNRSASPSPSPSFSIIKYGNIRNGVEQHPSTHPRMRRRSETELMDTENIPASPNKRPRRMESEVDGAFSSSLGRPQALLNNTILSSPPPFRIVQSHNSRQSPGPGQSGHVCKIRGCGFIFSTVTDLLRHTNHHHGLFKLRHYRLRKEPQCLICNSNKKLIQASPQEFTNHVYECLQSRREELGEKEWEPDLKQQIIHYLAILGSKDEWYDQLEDSPTSFTQDEYNRIMQEDNSSDEEEDEEVESDHPEESAEKVSESRSDSEDEDIDEMLQTVTRDMAHKVLISY